MAKSFLSLAQSRKTAHEFSPKHVSKADLLKILEAGRWAPSFLNLQPWEFVIVKESKAKEELLKSAYYGIYSFGDCKSLPPVVVAIVLKKKYWEEQYGYPRRDKPGIFEAYLSIAMPASNMVLEATDLGIASSIFNINAYVAARCLKLKDGDTVPLIVCFGYEKPGAKARQRIRKPLKSLLHYGHYGGKE